MVRRAHVLIVNEASRKNLHTAVSRMVRQKRVSGSQESGLGIWNLMLLALKRYGCGACCMTLYAMMLLG